MFLSNEIFDWPYEQQARRYAVNDDHVLRAREIWRHARDRLVGKAGNLDRIDCITSLKRSINHRLKALETEFAISKLPTNRSKKQVLETLRDYGLVRPSQLVELMKVRNEIEHKDATPPDIGKCQLYVDIVWYFLKSTDQLLDMVIAEIVCMELETNSFLTLEFHTSGSWKVNAEGLVRPSLINVGASEGALELLDFQQIDRSTKSAVRFKGVINLEPNIHLRMARHYFGVQGYMYEDNTI